MAVLRVTDVDVTARWYAETLGLCPEAAGVELFVGVPVPSVHRVTVPDVRACYEALVERHIAAAMIDGREVLVEDPDGYVLVLSEPIARSSHAARKQTPPIGVMAPRPRRPVTAKE